MKAAIFFFSILLAAGPCFSQQRIEEKVSVDWWVVPLFAVDRDGQPVGDLTKEDVLLLVNKRPVDGFVLTRRPFAVEDRLPQPQAAPPLPERKRMVFLVFDIAFMSLENFNKSLAIARSLVEGSAAATAFSIFTIDPFAGLAYIGGPLEDKADILALIQRKVGLNPRAKNIATVKDMNSLLQVDSKMGSKYTEAEIGSLREELSITSLKMANKNYVSSLGTLAYVLNAVQDNKFVYLFSEGISAFSRAAIRHQDLEFQDEIRKSAGMLGRSGALLFIIDPTPVSMTAADGSLGSTPSLFLPEPSIPTSTATGNENSGEDVMRYLAEESGGKYLEGEEKSISDRMRNVHRAYYEIAFPDSGDDRDRVRKVSVASRRPGVSIYTIHSLEKSRPYAELGEIEKEVFALNLVGRNPFFMKRMACLDMIVTSHRRKGEKDVYEILVPDGWLRQDLDLFKIRIDPGSGNATIDRSRWSPQKAEQTVELDVKNDTPAVFAVINPREQTALLLKPEIEKPGLPAANKTAEIKAMAEKFQYNSEMAAILEGVSTYCDTLKQAGFHFFCNEKVVETLNGLAQDSDQDISTAANLASDTSITYRFNRPPQGKKSLVSKFTFDYQLIKKENDVQEQRQPIPGAQGGEGEERAKATLRAFLSEKAVFAPITLFAKERQLLYEYRFVKYEKFKRVRCAVVEVLPRVREEAQYVYGQAWIDLADNSVLRIKANPRSIVGYDKLQALARQLHAKLFLELEITFNQSHAGIRFPDRVVLSERYKGGRLEYTDYFGRMISKPIGSGGWERSRIEYSYQDYRFFVVDVQSTERPQ
jgi:hypothetical protein